ncbi:hypothetical protein GGI24_006066, partial [Coemansia furcata]
EAVLRLAKENGWAVDGSVISLPVKSEVKASVINENVKFEQLTKMLSAANDI